MPPHKHSEFRLLRRLFGVARPYWIHIFGIFLISLLQAPIALITPLPLKIVVDSVLGTERSIFGEHEKSTILVLSVVLFIGIHLLTHLQGLAAWLLNTTAGEKLVLDFRSRMFRHLQRLSLAYHDTRGTADAIYRISYDAHAIQTVAIKGLIPFITSGITLVSMLYVTALIDWQLALIPLIISPVLYWLTRVFRRRLRSYWLEIKGLESAALGVVQEVMSAVRVVKAFGSERREEERFVQQSSKGVRGQIRVAWMEGTFGLIVGMMIACGMAAALYIGTLHVQQGVLTLGSLLLVTAYIAQVYKPLETIGKNVAQLQSSLAAAERAFDLLDEMPDVVEKADAKPLVRSRGEIEFEDVSFGYGEGRTAIESVSFRAAPGTRVGIFGRTGAGKTTLVSLLPRFYDPVSGTIRLDGLDIRDLRIDDLRNQFAIVLQDPFLFSTTIAENIAYGRPNAARNEIIEAAKMANVHDFIEGLPDGYDTECGERGVRLSGGERQRISLARAFLKNAPILIMDEPTSSVDTKTEASIIAAMELLMRDRTTFIIAHRLGTLRDCDIAFELEDGRIKRYIEREAGEHSLDLADAHAVISSGK